MAATSSSGSSSSGTSASNVSQCSTLEWEHEPFETFQHKVKELCQNTFWPGCDPDAITVERMEGGGYNRIIGISLEPKDGEKIDNILRIPRLEVNTIKRDVDVLNFIASNTSIPVPEIVCFDDGSSNVIGSPYAVHKRIHGEKLTDAYPKLTHQQRCIVAWQLGEAYKEMLKLSSTVPGYLGPCITGLGTQATAGSVTQMCISTLTGERWDADYPVFYTPYVDGPALTSTEDMLTTRFNLIKSRLLKKLPDDVYMLRLLDGFIKMVAELEETGAFLGSDYNSLVHPDVHPRNILVTTDSETDALQINIIDWDGAIFAPALFACRPPQWIWGWKDDEEEDERQANDEPETKENRELKAEFEQSAGDDYPWLAYGDVNRMARRLIEFAYYGIFTNEQGREAEEMLEEWAAHYEEYQRSNRRRRPGALEKIKNTWHQLPGWRGWDYLLPGTGLGSRYCAW